MPAEDGRTMKPELLAVFKNDGPRLTLVEWMNRSSFDELIEIAEGADLEKDVFGKMEFRPRVSPALKKMDPKYPEVTKEDKPRTAEEIIRESKEAQAERISEQEEAVPVQEEPAEAQPSATEANN